MNVKIFNTIRFLWSSSCNKSIGGKDLFDTNDRNHSRSWKNMKNRRIQTLFSSEVGPTCRWVNAGEFSEVKKKKWNGNRGEEDTEESPKNLLWICKMVLLKIWRKKTNMGMCGFWTRKCSPHVPTPMVARYIAYTKRKQGGKNKTIF